MIKLETRWRMIVYFLCIINFQSKIFFKIALNKVSEKFYLLSWYLVVCQIWIRGLRHRILNCGWTWKRLSVSWRIICLMYRWHAVSTIILVDQVLIYSEKLIFGFCGHLSRLHPGFDLSLWILVFTICIKSCCLWCIAHCSRCLWFLYIVPFLYHNLFIIETLHTLSFTQDIIFHVALAWEYLVATWLW